ncbi:MAG: choice-of-anchor D domain-containing protein [Bacteroidaceae bacterium]|nr:choice-of-anchor D domain-containing protein [Bacteroidaceae bacterium]
MNELYIKDLQSIPSVWRGRGRLLLILLLYLGIGARAGNVVTIGTASGAPGDEVTVSVSLTNTEAVSSLQVLIPLDENLSYVNGSAVLTNRCGNHRITAGVKDGVLSLIIYSMSLTAISGNSGNVASFKLKLGNQPATISLAASKVVLTDTNGNSLNGSTQQGTVSIRCAKAQYSRMTVDFGRVPIRSTYHQAVQVTNTGNDPLKITGVEFGMYPTRFSSDTTFPLIIAAGSSASIDIKYAPDVRGTVSEIMKVVCNSISKLNNITLKAQPYAVNELHIQAAEGFADETVTVSLTMNNMDAISGFQFEFTLPDALTYVPNSFTLSSRKQNHSVVESQTNGVLRILCYSPDDTPFTGEDGELATMQLKLTGRNSTNLKTSKCLLTATIDNQVTNVCSADYGAYINIRSPRISTNSSLLMGATPVTGDAVKELTVSNYGNAPLTISRVVFDKEGFSIKESLPQTIDSWNNNKLTIVYPSKEEGYYSTTMHIYSNDPEQRMWDVNVTGNRFAPNYMNINIPDIHPDDNLAIDVSVDTYDAITGLQFDLIYPNNYFEPFENNIMLASRATGMTVTTRQIDEKTVRFFCYFLSGKGLEVGNGKVMTIQMRPVTQNMPVGSYAIKVENIKLGTENMANKYAGSNLQSSFSVLENVSIIPGDVNGDGNISVTDVTMVINHILGQTPNGFIKDAADLNGDGSISVTDVTLIIGIILQQK